MSGLKIDYARVFADAQDLTAQRDALRARGVQPERIYVDHGLTGTPPRPARLRQALAACRAGDELVVTKLDRFARSLPDARAIADELTAREVTLALGTSVHDPTDPYGAGEHTVSELEELFGVTRSTACPRRPAAANGATGPADAPVSADTLKRRARAPAADPFRRRAGG